MDLTREDALALFRMMWTDMQNELGDNPDYDQRCDYKEKWVNAKLPNRDVIHNCFLCEYVKRKDMDACKRCPIDWGHDGIYDNACEKLCEPGVDWRKSPISEILALPEREDV